MTRRAAVVVEIDTVVDCRLDEAQHLLPLVFHGVAVIPYGRLDAEVNAEASAQSLDACGDAITGENLTQVGIQSLGDGTYVIVEARLSVSGHGCVARGDG